jgi:hypothetical protein
VQHLRDLDHQRRAKIASDDVAAERQRQTARPLRPPLTEIHNLAEPVIRIRQLPLVNQQTRFDSSLDDRRLNLVERHDHVVERRLVDAQGEVGGRQRARNRNPRALYRRGTVLLRHHDRPIPVSHAGAVRQKRVLVEQVGVRVKRDCRHLVAAVEGGAVQRLDIGQDLFDDDTVGVHVAARQPVEHERIIGVRAVGDSDSRGRHEN